MACLVLFCFVVLSLQGPLEQKNQLGIMFRHAYSLTAVEKVMCLKLYKPLLLEFVFNT